MTGHFPGLVQTVESDRVKLELWVQTSLNEMMWSCKWFPHMREMPTLKQPYFNERYNLEYKYFV